MPATRTSTYRETLRALKTRLVEGEWAPGERLPIRADFEAEFDVSHTTMQRVLNTLSREGFIHGRPSRGTFVAAHPPFLCRYALAFHTGPHHVHPESRFLSTLRDEASRWQEASNLQFEAYYGLSEHVDVEDYQRLLADLQARRLAGIVLPHALHGLRRTGLLDLPGAYYATIGQSSSEPGEPGVHLDFASFADLAMREVAEEGGQRVAVLALAHPGGTAERRDACLAGAAKRHGVSCPEHLRQFAEPFMPIDVQRTMQLLMTGDHRPDTLVITDDHLVDEALAAVLAMGLRIPRDLRIVAFANFPAGSAPIVPVTRIGFDVGEALRRAVALIDDQRRGNKPRERRVTARTENDYLTAAPEPRQQRPGAVQN